MSSTQFGRMDPGSTLTRRPLSDAALELVPWWTPSIPPWKPIKRPNSNLRIAAVVSDRLFDGLRFEGELMLLTPDNWKRTLKYWQPDLLIVESTWETATGHWYLAQTTHAEHSAELRRMIKAFRAKSVPSAYWITEDHVYHDHYRELATYFDRVFCADPEQTRHLLDEGVEADDLKPCVQPALYNPFRKHDEYDAMDLGILFDGWGDIDRRPEKFSILNEVALDQTLSIIESRYLLTKYRLQSGIPGVENVLGCVTPDSRISALKYSTAYITFSDSLSTKTTQQWRAIEAAASYVPVVHLGELEQNDFRHEFVLGCDTRVEFLAQLTRFQHDDLYRERLAHINWRRVLDEHTFSHRVQSICRALAVPFGWEEYPKASVITPTCRSEFVETAINNYIRQNYVNSELVLISNGFELTSSEFENAPSDIKVHCVPSDRFAASALNLGAQLSSGKFSFRMDDDDYYAENYLLDLMLCLRSIDADVLGKPMPPPFSFGDEKRVYLGTKIRRKSFVVATGLDYSKNKVSMPGNSIGFRSKNQKNNRYHDRSLHSADLFYRLTVDAGSVVMIGDGFNSIANRRDDLTTHTWRGDNEKLKRNAKQYPHAANLVF